MSIHETNLSLALRQACELAQRSIRSGMMAPVKQQAAEWLLKQMAAASIFFVQDDRQEAKQSA